MTELLIVGGILFVAYTLAKGQRAQLAMGGAPDVLMQNTGGRGTIIQGEPNSASPLQLTAQANAPVTVAAPVPAIQPPNVWQQPAPGGNLLQPAPGSVDNGSTSFSTSVAVQPGFARTTFQPVAGRYTV